MINIKKFTFNPIQENTFVIYDETHECIIIDAGCYDKEEQAELDGFISENNLKPVLMANTHCHFDHLLGVNYCREKYKARFFIPKNELGLLKLASGMADLFGISIERVELPDQELTEGDILNFGNSALKVIAADGHSPGGIVFYCQEQNFLVTGDALFYGSIGRSDLPGGNYENLVHNIKTKLLTLPEETKVYCGHGPETTIGVEKKNNPFLTD